jgi:hypothetical protein
LEGAQVSLASSRINNNPRNKEPGQDVRFQFLTDRLPTDANFQCLGIRPPNKGLEQASSEAEDSSTPNRVSSSLSNSQTCLVQNLLPLLVRVCLVALSASSKPPTPPKQEQVCSVAHLDKPRTNNKQAALVETCSGSLQLLPSVPLCLPASLLACLAILRIPSEDLVSSLVQR